MRTISMWPNGARYQNLICIHLQSWATWQGSEIIVLLLPCQKLYQINSDSPVLKFFQFQKDILHTVQDPKPECFVFLLTVYYK